MGLQDTITAFIRENFCFDDAARLQSDTSLLDSGIVDSTGVLEIIGFLERELGIRVEDEETTPENLDSIARICAFVERKRSGTAAAASAG